MTAVGMGLCGLGRGFRGRRWRSLGLALGLALVVPGGFARAAEAGPDAAAVLGRLDAGRGICCLVGKEVTDLALRLAERPGVLVFLQVAGPAEARSVCETAAAKGRLGRSLFVGEGPPARLGLAAEAADVVVAAGAGTVPRAEALRVLRPGGTAMLGPSRFTKPHPTGTDEWTHHYHGPDNNPQSRDRLARAPFMTQFVALPRYAPAPQSAVAAGGRLFMAFGHVAWHRREEPWMNTLLAVNAFNGTHLWRRPIEPGFMVDRSMMVATADLLYLATRRACLVLDAATGAVRDEITAPADLADGRFWKWLALADGRLYALVGPDEPPDAEARWRRAQHGWPWGAISKGYNAPAYRWGFGRTLLAFDPGTKRVLWRHQEERPIDSRGIAMAAGRLFACRFGEYLVCLDAATGKELWRRTRRRDPDLFEAIGPYRPGHGYIGGWKSTVYLRCTDRAVYFLGPQVERLTALAAEDGRLLWQLPLKDLHVVVREDGLWTVGPQNSRDLTRRLDPLTGRVLATYTLHRRACTRSTGAADGIYFRTQGGTQRLDLATGRVQYITPMRPSCQVGVLVAHGHLYWVPWVCDCNLQMFGVIACGPAGDADLTAPATEAEHLEATPGASAPAPFPVAEADWPTYRHDPARTARTSAPVPKVPRRLWTFAPPHPVRPTAPTAAGGRVFVADRSGTVRALDAATGRPVWTAYTGGPVWYPPTIAEGLARLGLGVRGGHGTAPVAVPRRIGRAAHPALRRSGVHLARFGRRPRGRRHGLLGGGHQQLRRHARLRPGRADRPHQVAEPPGGPPR